MFISQGKRVWCDLHSGDSSFLKQNERDFLLGLCANFMLHVLSMRNIFKCSKGWAVLIGCSKRPTVPIKCIGKTCDLKILPFPKFSQHSRGIWMDPRTICYQSCMLISFFYILLCAEMNRICKPLDAVNRQQWNWCVCFAHGLNFCCLKSKLIWTIDQSLL